MVSRVAAAVSGYALSWWRRMPLDKRTLQWIVLVTEFLLKKYTISSVQDPLHTFRCIWYMVLAPIYLNTSRFSVDDALNMLTTFTFLGPLTFLVPNLGWVNLGTQIKFQIYLGMKINLWQPHQHKSARYQAPFTVSCITHGRIYILLQHSINLAWFHTPDTKIC